MSDTQDLSLDLEKAFLPSWAQQPADQNRFANYSGNEGADRGDRRGGRGGFGDRPPRRDGPGGPGRGGPRPGGFGSPRPGGFGGGPGGPRRDFRGPRPGGPAGPGAPGGEGQGLKWDPTAGGGRPPFRGGRRDDRRDQPEPLPPIDVEMRPDPAGVVSLARQIKLSGRAYPLLEVAGLVIQKPDRYEITFRPMRDKEGNTGVQFFVCSLDDSIWLSEGEAIRHALKAHFDTFYQVEKTPCDPPKGVWTLVAQFDEIILGPPNYHGYQEKLREIHAQRAPRLPFEVFKSKVRMVKDEAAVKGWLEGQSSKQQFVALNVEEAQTLHSMAAVEEHFRAKHAPNVIKATDSWSLNRQPNAPRLPEPLTRVLRVSLERERRFPIRTMTALSGAFAHAGLQFFKRDKTAVHVAVARPHYLDLENTLVQPGIKRIIEFVNTTQGPTRKKLLAALAPAPVEAIAPAPVAETAATVEPKDGPAPETAAAPVAEAPAAPAAEAAPAVPQTTAAQQAVLSDLHWLVHQGHVIEFASGLLETAKKPQPKPEVPAAPAKPKEPRVEKPRKERPLTKQGRYVSDNCGLLPVPAPNVALIGL
jgi:hypothetical protein